MVRWVRCLASGLQVHSRFLTRISDLKNIFSMTIEKRIEVDFLKAFKEKNVDAKNILGTVKGEMQTLKKNLVVETLSDETAIDVLNKFAKNLNETIRLTNDEKSKKELAIIETYLPKALSQDEIIKIMDEAIASGANNIGAIMKVFAKLPVDKRLVSELAKSKI